MTEGSLPVLGKAIDNSQVVRERDPRAYRDLFWLLLLVGALVAGVVLYAWPHLQVRQTGYQTEQMHRERERLLEENRKLRLEKASLENLKRVESIAEHELGMGPPPGERVIVVEPPKSLPDGARLASKGPPSDARN
jgi:cell division protein FtsL